MQGLPNMKLVLRLRYATQFYTSSSSAANKTLEPYLNYPAMQTYELVWRLTIIYSAFNTYIVGIRISPNLYLFSYYQEQHGNVLDIILMVLLRTTW